MAVPTFKQLKTMINGGGPGVPSESLQERIITLLAILASGQNPDGTAFSLPTTPAAGGSQVVVGPVADGVAPTGNPVLVAGFDGANTQTLLTDTSGRAITVGGAAQGAAASGNPSLISGTSAAGGTGTVQVPICDTNGSLQVGLAARPQGFGVATVLSSSAGTGGNRLLTCPISPGVVQSPSSAVVSNAATSVTITAAAATVAHITGFEVTGNGATVSTVITVTVTGTISGTLNYVLVIPVLAQGVSYQVEFPQPIPATAVNTSITVNLPAFGAGNTAAAVVAHGFTL